jgi:phage tail sheath protein FI
MALFTPSASPAVTVKEIDLTGVVPNVQTSTGAFVGKFGWGPVGVPTLVSDENGLVSTFSSPDSSSTVDFHSAAYFLRYSNALQLVREVDSDKNALCNHDNLGSLTAQQIKNADAFEDVNLDSSDGVFLAKYPGKLGSSLGVSVFGSLTDTLDNGQAAKSAAFGTWDYASEFDDVPGTSKYIASLNGKNDELHVVVYDNEGSITGVQGTVLETFPFLSVAKNAKNADGTSNYFKDVLKTRSQWVYAGVPHSDAVNANADFGANALNATLLTGDSAGDPAATFSDTVSNWNSAVNNPSVTKDFGSPVSRTSQQTWNFHSGETDTDPLSTGSVLRGFDKFEDVDNIEVDFLISPLVSTDTDAKTIVNDLVATAGSIRKDCVAVASPSAAAINTGTNTAVINCNKEYTKSSYLVQDNNFLKVYDKYNDKYIKIPAASSTAGLMAATDLVAAPWFSPAGSRRGRYLGITDIILSPSKSERDQLYKNGINPIANIPGEGIMLYGDKTSESRPSAFDRINVRRLFLGIERAIAIAGRNVMFEFNDEFTRAEFVNIIEPFLREIQGRRGITDFRVVCDETNNTGAVIDRNEFIASIFIKPARSINYVTLNFVAVRTGVDFEEVVGTV